MMTSKKSISRRQILGAYVAGTGFAAVSAGGTPSSVAATNDDLVMHSFSQLRARAEARRLAGGEALAATETALIIVDMMNLFCDPVWMSGGSPDEERRLKGVFARIVPNIQETLQAFRRVNALVVHVTNAKWTREGREVVPYQRRRDYGLFDSERMSVIDALKPVAGEIQIRKVTSSAFTATGLDFLLRNAGIRNVVLCGQYGNACVFYSLIQSRELGFDSYWLEDAMLYGNASSRLIFEPLIGAKWARLVTTQTVVGAVQS